MRRRPNRMELALQLIAALMTFALFFSFVRADAAVVAWGDKGDQVTLIQQKLKQYGYFSGTVDGVFGKQTYDAVVWFQRKNGLKVDGVVGESTVLGKYLTVRHADGYETLYAHCSKITVSSGQSVLRGDTLGAVGATGNATGAHLHFELLSGSKYLDPIAYAAKTV